MPNNCRILLPPDVRLEDVAAVVAKLLGNPHTLNALENGSVGVSVDGYQFERVDDATMVRLSVINRLESPSQRRSAYYHFEVDNDPARLLSALSDPLWCAVGRELVEFFGGSAIWQDIHSEISFLAEKPREINNPGDGEKWQELQHAIAAVPPLTADDLKLAREFAAYQERSPIDFWR